VYLLRSRTFRPLSFFFVGPFVLFALVRGRGYYLLPAYVPIYAAAGVAFEQWIINKAIVFRRTWRTLAFAATFANAAVIAAMFLPISRPGSTFFLWQMKNNFDMGEEIGRPDFVNDVSTTYNSLSREERAGITILAENYGEASALMLYGPRHNLPAPISEINSFHARGYGPFAPENLLITGGTLEKESKYFQSCRIAGHVKIPYNLHNLEYLYGRDILLCSHPRFNWAQKWPELQRFG
jgi:hypothetical protein